jgi:hypothetical protein
MQLIEQIIFSPASKMKDFTYYLNRAAALPLLATAHVVRVMAEFAANGGRLTEALAGIGQQLAAGGADAAVLLQSAVCSADAMKLAVEVLQLLHWVQQQQSDTSTDDNEDAVDSTLVGSVASLVALQLSMQPALPAAAAASAPRQPVRSTASTSSSSSGSSVSSEALNTATQLVQCAVVHVQWSKCSVHAEDVVGVAWASLVSETVGWLFGSHTDEGDIVGWAQKGYLMGR